MIKKVVHSSECSGIHHSVILCLLLKDFHGDAGSGGAARAGTE